MAFFNSCPYSSRRNWANCGSNQRGHCGRRGLCCRRNFNDIFGMDWNDWNLQLSLLSDYCGDNDSKKDDKDVNTKVCPIRNDANKFEIKLDVSHYSPEEFTVKTVDNYIVIDCKHDEKKDEYGWISRQFTRKFVLPDDVDIEKVHSTLSSNGVLTVEVPKKIFKSKGENVVLIPVIHEKESVNSKDGSDNNFEVIDKVNEEKKATKQQPSNE